MAQSGKQNQQPTKPDENKKPPAEGPEKSESHHGALEVVEETLISGWTFFYRGLAVAIPLVLVIYALFLLFWSPTPQTIRIGTAWPGSFYHEFGETLGESLKEQGIKARIEVTQGTPDNIERLRLGLLDAALVQGGAYRVGGSKAEAEPEGREQAQHLAIVSPISTEVVYVLVHKSSPILEGLNGKLHFIEVLKREREAPTSFYCGAPHSGAHISAEQILRQYGRGFVTTRSQKKLDRVTESPPFSFWEDFRSPQETGTEPLRMALLKYIAQETKKESISASAIHAHFKKTREKDYQLERINRELLWLIDSGYLEERRGGTVAIGNLEYGKSGGVEDRYPKIAIITTNPNNKRLNHLLSRGEYRLVSLDGGAMARRYPFFREHTIPQRRYGTRVEDDVAIPSEDVITVSTTAYLAVRKDAPPEVVNDLIQARHSHALRAKYSRNLISTERIKSEYLADAPFHASAEDYYDPFNPEEIATWVEFLSGSKELLIALGAGIYLAITLRRRYLQNIQDRAMEHERAILDRYLKKTAAIEKAQMTVTDPERLRKYLDVVTLIKLRAIRELTHLDLKGDRRFSIFLMQCANLISKMQFKILTYHSHLEQNVAE